MTMQSIASSSSPYGQRWVTCGCEFKQEGLLAARLQKIEFTNNCHHNVYEQEFDRDHARSLSETQASTDKPMSDGSWSYISKETSSSNRHAL
ncbi:hypothetical protein MPTK1_6g05435 [Marchantia polymorpha subsp. ruderalis]